MRYQRREYTTRIQLPLIVVAFVTILAACESPMGVSPPEMASSEPTALLSSGQDAGIIVDAEGVARPIESQDLEAMKVAPGERGVAVVIAGRATFNYNTVPALRVNVRQTKDGAIAGEGRVTMSNQTIDFTPVCVKKRELWGRSYYGITMKLDEPYDRYGRPYEYATVTITGDGHLSPGLIYRNEAVCGYSAALYAKEPTTGHINVDVKQSNP